MGQVDSWSPPRAPGGAGNTKHPYRTPSDQDKLHMLKVNELGLDFAAYVDQIGSSRELSVAKTKIEEAVMWAQRHFTGWRFS